MKKLHLVFAATAAVVLLFSCTKTKVIELTVSPQAVNFTADAGSDKVNITCNDAWTASTTADWVTLSPASGEGNAQLGISVSANGTLTSREASVTIKAGELSRTVKVGQLGQEPALAVDVETLEVTGAGEVKELTITSNTTWTVTIPEGVDWVSADATSGEGNGKVTLTVDPNRLLKVRGTTVTVSAGANLSKDVALSQQGGEPTRYTDSLALVAFYNAAKGAQWAKNNWDLEKPMDDWDFVTLDDGGRVSSLRITAAGVMTEEWELPDDIADLTALTELRLNQNKLTGPIPERLYTLTGLTKLYLQNNNLTGSLSSKLGDLQELTELYIDRNENLEGPIPASIGQLKKLVSINIARTGISGAIPQELASCSSLKNFMAYSNKLSGTIPDFWESLPNIGALQLYGNPGLTGEIPASIGTLKLATGIQLKDCNLTGNIPASFGGLEKCSNLQLNGNKLSGVIPAEVQAHPKFQPTSGWKYESNILPQQEGYTLTLE